MADQRHQSRTLVQLGGVLLATVFLLRLLPMACAQNGAPLNENDLVNTGLTMEDVRRAEAFDQDRLFAMAAESASALIVLVLAIATVIWVARRNTSPQRRPRSLSAIAVQATFLLVVVDSLVFSAVRTFGLHRLEVSTGLNTTSTGAFFGATFVDALTAGGIDGALFLVAFAIWRRWPRGLLLAAPALAMTHAILGWVLVATLQPHLAVVEDAAAARATCSSTACARAIDHIDSVRAEFAPAANFVVVKTSLFDTRLQAFASGPAAGGTLWLYDSTFQAVSAEGATAMALHELGHLAHHHAPLEALFDAVMAFLFALVWLLLFTGDAREADRFRNVQRQRLLSLLLCWWLFASIFQGIEDPLRLALRRQFEFQADTFALSHGSPAGAAEVERVGSQRNRLRLNPHPVAALFLESHPAPLVRLRRAQQWAPATKGMSAPVW